MTFVRKPASLLCIAVAGLLTLGGCGGSGATQQEIEEHRLRVETRQNRVEIEKYAAASAAHVSTYLRSVSRVTAISKYSKNGTIPTSQRAPKFTSLAQKLTVASRNARKLDATYPGLTKANRHLVTMLTRQATAARNLALSAGKSDTAAVARARASLRGAASSFRLYSTALTSTAAQHSANIKPFSDAVKAFSTATRRVVTTRSN